MGAIYVNQQKELIWALCSGLTFGWVYGGAPTGDWILASEMETDGRNRSTTKRGLICGLGIRLGL